MNNKKEEKPNPNIKPPEFAIQVFNFGIAGAVYQPDDPEYKYHKMKMEKYLNKLKPKQK
jgi:hypothetical protein